MPTREDLLRKKTHKGDGLSSKERVYYSLTDEPQATVQRACKLLSVLIEKLHEERMLSEEDLDALLLECTR